MQKKTKPAPADADLSRRERQIMDVLFGRGLCGRETGRVVATRFAAVIPAIPLLPTMVIPSHAEKPYPIGPRRRRAKWF